MRFEIATSIATLSCILRLLFAFSYRNFHRNFFAMKTCDEQKSCDESCDGTSQNEDQMSNFHRNFHRKKLAMRSCDFKSQLMLLIVGFNPISTLDLNLRNWLSEQNSEVTTGKEIIFYVDPPGEEFIKNYSSSSYRAAKIS